MDILERLATSGFDISGLPTNTPEMTKSGIRVLDGDTVETPDGKRVRFSGINTEEPAKMLPDKISSGFTGAEEQKKILKNLIDTGGYTNPVISDKKDVHDRFVGDLANKDGQTVTQYMLNNGLAMPTKFTTSEQQSTAAWAQLEKAQRKDKGTQTPEDLLSDTLLKAQFPNGTIRAKIAATSAKQYGGSLDSAGHSEYFSGPMYVNEDEDRTGHAKSNLKTGLKSGYTSMQQGAFDALDSLGVATGSDFLKNYGASHGDALQADLVDLPYLRDAEPFDEQGHWKLDSFSKVGNYVVGTAASSAPQFFLSIAAGLAAPATFGASLSLPAVVYAGNTWRAQAPENKSVAWAWTSGITQSAIESLGITGVFTNIFEKKAQKEIIKQLMGRGMTEEAAEKLLISKTQEGIKQVAEAVKAVKGGAIRQAGVASAKGVLNEAPEEMLQEMTQYFGENAKLALPESAEDISKLKNRIINAGIGGAVLGGSLGGAHEVLRNIPRAQIPESKDREFRTNLLQTDKEVPTAVSEANKALAVVGTDKSLDTLADLHESKLAMKGSIARVSNWWKEKGLSSLWKANYDTVMGKHTYAGRSLAALGTLLGANRAFAGGSIDEQKEHNVIELFNTFGSLDEMRSSFKGAKPEEVTRIFNEPSVKDYIKQIINERTVSGATFVSEIADKVKPEGVLSVAMMEHKDAIVKYADKLDKFLVMYNNKTNHNMDIFDLFNNKPINKTHVAQNKERFAALLSKQLGLNSNQATEITNRILTNDNIQDITDSFDDILNFDSSYSALKRDATAKLNEEGTKVAFNEFFSHDLHHNLVSLANKGASTYINTAVIGHKGAKLNALLLQAIANGEITEDEAAFKAKEIRDWLDMRMGKYHEITNQYLSGALSLVNFLTTITSLPLAAISSTVEFSQIYRNLNLPQSISATRHLLVGFGGEIGHVVKSIGGKEDVSNYRNTLSRGGYAHSNIAARTDVVSGYFAKWSEGFFKVTGLTSVTNVTRYAKLAIASDAIKHWLTQHIINPESEAGKSAYENLIRIGVDVESIAMMDIKSPEYESLVKQELTKGTHNFVLEAVIHPTKMNRPKFYSDPYLQVFTQFQGYVSTFTATILPRLVRDIRRTGTVEQANAAAVIAMMMALTLFALYMKDMIKYGESPPKWLEDDKRFHRFIGQSGLTGTGQRIWDAVSPIKPEYNKQSNVALSAVRAVSDQAPALSFLGNINDALSAPEGSQIKKTARILPIFGTSPQFAEYLQKELGAH